MVIMSQDKTMLINFDNIESMDIVADLDEPKTAFKIYYSTNSTREALAKYSTQEKAEKVLLIIAERNINNANGRGLYILPPNELVDDTDEGEG